MRVLIINMILHTAEKGAIVRRDSNRDCMIYNMARGFIAGGHEVTLVASEEFKPLKDEDPGFEVVYFPSVMPGIFRPDLLPYPKGFHKWMKRNAERFDYILSSETFSIPTLTAARVAPEKLVIWQEMALMQHAFMKIPARTWYNAVAPMLMRGVRVVARSERAKEFISRYMDNVAEDIVDHGTDGDVFYPSEAPKDRSFVIVARLVPGKRIDRIMRKFADFTRLDGYGDFRLDIVGDGESRNSLERLAEELGLERQVTFHGNLAHKDFAGISRKAMALLVDTEKDLNMVSIPEAICSGTPVMMNEVPTTSVFVNAEQLGIAREGWTAEDLRKVVDNNAVYVENCRRVRDGLLNAGCARRLIELR